ncbi:2Fe-2S iron-sulfur cluster binding domain protein [Amylocarpus encephaloides]|uniref:2Fe-2S iron-sulfur cluster binding domain protein n=1 Tax=Amylocarpus encephaloides TaxID=45428 RepID=A0A9P8C0H8_9HELO|nr:2Fe-2S iron-sulfur cluster binding domain protein [Amylocarpus encephaloides]
MLSVKTSSASLATAARDVSRNLVGAASATRRIPSRPSIFTIRPVASSGNVARDPWQGRGMGSAQRTRLFSAAAKLGHEHVPPPAKGQELYVTFVDKDGMAHKLAVREGDNLLSIAQTHEIEMEGACEGSCACSTCHIIVTEDKMFDQMPEATDDENDMLDLAFGLTETSRLGCQIEMTKGLDGLVVRLPNATRNMQASNFK